MSTDLPASDPGAAGAPVALSGDPAEAAGVGAMAPTGMPGPATAGVTGRPLETLNNVELPVTVELGRTRLRMKDLLNLRPGSVVELDRTAGAPVDILVNHTLLAHGEVVVVDDELGVRVTGIVGTDIDAGI